MMPLINKAFDLKSDDLGEISTENDSLKNKICFYDRKWLEESIARPLEEYDDKKSKLNYVKTGKTNERTLTKWHIQIMMNHGEVSFITMPLQRMRFKI